mmetsp:Transcript_21521/g.33175  ORF Transcript_21521/g.33175 Transcript_21521/m.33175 type:complete len:327 (-) Transcript_21521:77-1057(-)|eukprot:CAMPEP_0195281106 /NCGR_PEP_ID=MMETSP0707-20130614/555_1 /TAXON_ID=33640 /ORGANISM="Asterionellopsis glacialis, Strain CCMP134" /LENGTH=326 /DNA_ID=CAMNT_0040339953 /DNA_START=103 /DNA_END=1083 /DNA_ORIENTATION=-
MGGDGGVIASNRKYLRGAGTADHTGDHKRCQQQRSGFAAEKEAAKECMTTCAISGKKLNFAEIGNAVVVCPYGRLYHREAALEALLRRKQQDDKHSDNEGDELGNHIRGMKDLYAARFEIKKDSNGNMVPVCPITGVELNGSSPALLLHKPSTKKKKNKKTSNSDEQSSTSWNVVSERAIKEMGMKSLQTELGEFDEEDMIRLAPPSSMMENIQEKLTKRRETEKLSKKSSKKDKKRKKASTSSTANNDGGQAEEMMKKSQPRNSSTDSTGNVQKRHKKEGVAEATRMRVESAVKSNDVLSSLFTSNDKTSVDLKQKDNLCGGYVK